CSPSPSGPSRARPRTPGGELRPKLCAGRQARRASDPGAAATAITPRVLGEVLLVVVFGVVELSGGADLGGDGLVARLAEHALGGIAGGEGRLLLRVALRVDRRSVLGAHVVAPAHALSWR